MTSGRRLKAGLAALEAKKIATAVQHFDALLAARPDHFLALLYRGDACLERGDLPAALADWSRAEIANPRSHLPSLRSGLARVEARRYQNALRDFEHSLRRTALNPEAWNGRGMARFWHRNYAEAVDAYSRAIRLASTRFPKADKSRYLANRAEAYVRQRQFATAKADCDRALTLVPGERFALYVRGLAKLGLGDAAGAKQDWQVSAKAGDTSARDSLKRLARHKKTTDVDRPRQKEDDRR